jgi:hypothetical protein
LRPDEIRNPVRQNEETSMSIAFRCVNSGQSPADNVRARAAWELDSFDAKPDFGRVSLSAPAVFPGIPAGQSRGSRGIELAPMTPNQTVAYWEGVGAFWLYVEISYTDAFDCTVLHRAVYKGMVRRGGPHEWDVAFEENDIRPSEKRKR